MKGLDTKGALWPARAGALVKELRGADPHPSSID